MQFLVAADTHDTLTETNIPEELLAANIDAVFILGDVSQRDITILQKKFPVQFFGVGGNHDTWDLLKKCGVEDVHARVIRWKKLRIAGFGGSLRYKETPHYMFFTEDEARDILNQMPDCDILLTHAAPKYEEEEPVKVSVSEPKKSFLSHLTSFFAKNNPNPYSDHIDTSAEMYKGLYGIGEYVQKHHPTFVLHGHVHTSDIEWREQTCVRSFYGLELFELDN